MGLPLWRLPRLRLPGVRVQGLPLWRLRELRLLLRVLGRLPLVLTRRAVVLRNHTRLSDWSGPIMDPATCCALRGTLANAHSAYTTRQAFQVKGKLPARRPDKNRRPPRYPARRGTPNSSPGAAR